MTLEGRESSRITRVRVSLLLDYFFLNISGLAQVLEKDASTSTASKTIRQLELEHAQDDEREAHLIAEKRSGARGARAREVLMEKEDDLRAAESRSMSYISKLSRPDASPD